MFCRQVRQIVRPTSDLYGFLPGFDAFCARLISVRSVVRVHPGPFSEVIALLGFPAKRGSPFPVQPPSWCQLWCQLSLETACSALLMSGGGHGRCADWVHGPRVRGAGHASDPAWHACGRIVSFHKHSFGVVHRSGGPNARPDGPLARAPSHAPTPLGINPAIYPSGVPGRGTQGRERRATSRSSGS